MSNILTEELIKKASKEDPLNKVYKLDLSIQNLEKIQNLELIPQLRCLILNCNKINAIENIRVLSDLRELHLENNNIKKIAGLDNCKNLTVLNLFSNKIELIENISHLTKLETLNLQYNQLQRLTAIDNLKDLKTLLLGHNKISALDYIPAFSKLQTISLQHNKIANINNKFFDNAVKLIRLDLSNNQLKSITFVQCLHNLEILNLSNNLIHDINLETVFSYLQTLDLSNNEISDLPYLPNIFPELMHLNLANNYITNEYDLIQSVAGMQYIVEMDFRENPMYNASIEETIKKMHDLDIVNGKIVAKTGDKYKQKIKKITKEFRDFPEIYLDSKFNEEITNTGFYDEELEFEMTGKRSNRPVSPQRRIKQALDKEQELLENEQAFLQYIKQTNEKVSKMRNQYIMIFKRNGILPENAPNLNNTDIQERQRFQSSKTLNITSSNPIDKLIENLKVEAEQNHNKWKELKAKQKNFQIRDLRKKKNGVEEAEKTEKTLLLTQHQASLPKVRSKIDRLDMMKTQQINPFENRAANQALLTKTYQKSTMLNRPSSMKK